jgi:hypothetical protein
MFTAMAARPGMEPDGRPDIVANIDLILGLIDGAFPGFLESDQAIRNSASSPGKGHCIQSGLGNTVVSTTWTR